jgi:hypothetical protein
MPYSEHDHQPWLASFLALLSLVRTYLDILLASIYPDMLLPSVDLYGKLAIVTGANSGIGYEIARALASRGAQVVLACRNFEKGGVARDRIIRETGNSKVELEILDCASFKSVTQFLERWERRVLKKVDILVNNAGKYLIHLQACLNNGQFRRHLKHSCDHRRRIRTNIPK